VKKKKRPRERRKRGTAVDIIREILERRQEVSKRKEREEGIAPNEAKKKP